MPWLKISIYLAAVAVCCAPTAEGALRQCNMLDDLREVQVDLQQQILAPLTDHAARKKGQMCFRGMVPPSHYSH